MWKVQVLVEGGVCGSVGLCCHFWDGRPGMKWKAGKWEELELYHVLVGSSLKNEQNGVRVWGG